jgi:hypothetical protein
MEEKLPFYACTVNEIGPAADGTETPDEVVYVNLSDTQGNFTNQWFYASEGSQNQMLAVGLTAMNKNRQIYVAADPPNAGGTPYSPVQRMYLTLSSASLIAPVFDLNGTWEPIGGTTTEAIISVNQNYLSINIPGRPLASGTIVDRSDIVVNFPDATTVSGKLQPPSTIAWSNGTSWQKV